MTETTTRIRWEPTEHGGFIGHVGTLDPWVLQIWRPDDSGVLRLDSTLPGQFGCHVENTDPKPLKAEAERWLEEFVASLGAVFPNETDPFGPEAYKSHTPGCMCWDCQAAREEAAKAAGTETADA
jgi:hypothetical protein